MKLVNPRIAAVFVLAWVAPIALLAQPPSDGISAVELKAKVARVYDALRDNRVLRGAWVSYNLEGNRWVFTPTVDDAQSMEQLSEIRKVLTEVFQSGTFEVNSRVGRLPVSSLLTSLREAVAEAADIPSCKVEGFYFDLPRSTETKDRAYEKSLKHRILHIYGRIAPGSSPAETNARRQRVATLCDTLMRKDKDWMSLRQSVEFDIVADGLVEVQQSYAASMIFLRDGVNNFWSGRYADASRDFCDALVEDPGNQMFITWQALSEIGAGNAEKAFRLIRPQARQRRYGAGNPTDGLGQQFERVQGPIRSKFHELERRALLETVEPAATLR